MLVALVVSVCASAHAQAFRIATYSAPETCPALDVLESRLVSIEGMEPRSLHVEITQAQDLFVANVRLHHQGNAEARELVSPRCESVIDAVETLVRILVTGSPVAPTPSAPVQDLVAESTPEPPPSLPSSLHGDVALYGMFDSGALSQPTGGLGARGMLSWRGALLILDAWVLPSTTITVPLASALSASARFLVGAGALGVGYRWAFSWGALGAYAAFEVGSIYGEGLNNQNGLTASRLWLAPRANGLLEVNIAWKLRFFADLGVAVPLLAPTFEFADGTYVSQSAPASFRGVLGFSLHFE